MAAASPMALASTSERSATRTKRTARTRRTLIGLSALLVVVVWASIGTGAVSIGPWQVLGILLKQIGIETAWAFEVQQELVLTAIRLPRVLLGLLIGAGLAVSGAAMQGLFRNPLADPGLVGVSSGAALAAVLVIVLGGPLLVGLATWMLPFAIAVAAFGGSIAATLIVYRLATWRGRTSVATMLLAGIALNALAAAGVGLMMFIADDAQLRDITFWTLGSLGGATWSTLGAVAPFLLLGIVGAPLLARALNAMLLGEAEARHLGIHVEHLKRGVVLITALTVGAAVAVSGIIGFVGLVVPHLLRLTLGPDHRGLLPGSALLGAILLLAADLLSRTLVAPAELPIGIVTALVGAPFFLWLLLRNRAALHL
ncbi:MAG: iron ABC transporter permease [Rhodothermales bacterium]